MSPRQEAAQTQAVQRRVRELVADAPPLSPATASRLALLLRPVVKAAAAQRVTRGAA